MMKTMSWPRTVLLAATLLLPPGLQAQEGRRWERVQQAYTEQETARIREVVREAARHGVPAEPILDKALEGSAKGVPPAMVLSALGDYAGRLERAGALVGAAGSRTELVAAADALRRGVPEGAIRDVSAGPGDGSIALVVLGDLVEMEVPVARARDVVADALRRGAQGEQLLTVPARVRRLIREGVLPPEAAARVQEAMAQGRIPGGSPTPGQGAGPRATPPGNPPVPPGAGPPEGRGRPPGGGGPGGGGPGGGGGPPVS